MNETGEQFRPVTLLATDDETFSGLEALARTALEEPIEVGSDGYTYLKIPAEDIYWSTSIWHFTEEGRMVHANVLFSEALSSVLGRNASVYSGSSRRDPETGEVITFLIAKVDNEQSLAEE